MLFNNPYFGFQPNNNYPIYANPMSYGISPMIPVPAAPPIPPKPVSSGSVINNYHRKVIINNVSPVKKNPYKKKVKVKESPKRTVDR